MRSSCAVLKGDQETQEVSGHRCLCGDRLVRGDEEAALHRLGEAADDKAPYEAFNLLMDIAANVYKDPALDQPAFANARNELKLTDL